MTSRLGAFLTAANAAALPAVQALDEAHGHLVSARAVAAPSPAERWYRLLDQFASKSTVTGSATAGPFEEVGERTDRFARDLLIAAAAFLAAEANDLQDRIELLDGNHPQKGIHERLNDIADKVGDTADAFLDRVENGKGEEFLGAGLSELNEARSSMRSNRIQAASRPAVAALTSSSSGKHSPLLRIATCFAIGVGLTAAGSLIFAGPSLPQGTATILLGVVVLVGLTLLFRTSWTIQALQPKLRRQAEERRKLNEEWAAVRTARRRRSECSRCRVALAEQYWYFASTTVENPTDDD